MLLLSRVSCCVEQEILARQYTEQVVELSGMPGTRAVAPIASSSSSPNGK